MKRIVIMVVVMVLAFVSFAWAEEINTPMYTVNLFIADSGATKVYTAPLSGSTTAINGASVFYINDTATTVLDVSNYRPVGYFSIQCYKLDRSPAVQNHGTYANYGFWWSGSTITLRYRASNIDDPVVWAQSGTTNIAGPFALSGASNAVYTFAPVLAKYYKFEMVSGVTPFGDVRALLAIQ